MELLEKKIQKDGIVKAGNVLKVDHFLNPQMDIALFNEMGKEFKRLFADRPVNKILTIEASGIGIACIAAQYFQVPVVFAKKAQSINIDGEVYSTKIESFTHKRVYDVIVSRKYLGPEDHILIIDDFLANGCAVNGLLELIESAGASVDSRWAESFCVRKGIMWSRWPSLSIWMKRQGRSVSGTKRAADRGGFLCTFLDISWHFQHFS